MIRIEEIFRVLYTAIKNLGTAYRHLKVYRKKCSIYAVCKCFEAIKYANLTPIDARFLKRKRIL